MIPPSPGIERLAGGVALGLDEDLGAARCRPARAGPGPGPSGSPCGPRPRPPWCRPGRRRPRPCRTAPAASPRGSRRRAAIRAAAELCQVVGRAIGRVVGQHDRVAAAVVAGQVVQADLQLAGGQLVRAAVLPDPALGLALAEDVLDRLAAQDDLEPARGCARGASRACGPRGGTCRRPGSATCGRRRP